jgi:hypothetical protein
MMPSKTFVVIAAASGGRGKTLFCRGLLIQPQFEPAHDQFQTSHQGRRKTPAVYFPGNPAKGDYHGKLR